MLDKITVIIITKNEEKNLPRCLAALQDFDDIIVVDSNSIDATKTIAEKAGARVINFSWNGQYPKKRQWCLDTISDTRNFILFIDADEIMIPELSQEIKHSKGYKAGYFIKGQYILNKKTLRYGLKNNKLCLIDKNKILFPEINDLSFTGMGEIEGHYQPVLKPEYTHEEIGQLKSPLLHFAYEENWYHRHQNYAQWEAKMNAHNAWPNAVTTKRKILKSLFRKTPFRPAVAFTHSYIVKAGFLDGKAGYNFALSRAAYYKMIATASKNQDKAA